MSASATLPNPEVEVSENDKRSPPVAAELAAAAQATGKPADGEPCPKCGAVESWGTASWCPHCGYYPRLNVCTSPEGRAKLHGEVHNAPSNHWEALSRLPQWAYVLAGGVLAIFVLSVFVRAATPDDSFARSAWSVTQLFLGGLTFIVIHCYAFIRASMKSDGHSYWDVIVHPLEVWRPTFRELPATAKRVWAGLWGFTAAACAILIIGGIDYEVLTRDWGFKERPKQNLMKQIKDQMMANARDVEKGADDLGDAVKDFAGDDSAMNKAKDKKEADLEILSAECVVVGFNVNKETGKVSELLLASIVDGKLVYVGTIAKGIPPDVEEQLTARLPQLQQDRPFVKCNYLATWVKPTVTCRAAFQAWTENKLMERPVFKGLLAEVDEK
ncbi:MAG: ATP dependent DNA ligase [Planctomycetaceae bacterium]